MFLFMNIIYQMNISKIINNQKNYKTILVWLIPPNCYYYITVNTQKQLMLDIPKYKRLFIIIYLASALNLQRQLTVKAETINIIPLSIQHSSIPSELTFDESPPKINQNIRRASAPSQIANIQLVSLNITTELSNQSNQSNIDNFTAFGQYRNITFQTLIHSSNQQNYSKYESNQTQFNKTQKMHQAESNESEQEPPSLPILSNAIDQNTYTIICINNSMMGSNDLQDLQTHLFNLQSIVNGNSPNNNLSKNFATEDSIPKNQQINQPNSNHSSKSQSDSVILKKKLEEMKDSINERFNTFLSGQSRKN